MNNNTESKNTKISIDTLSERDIPALIPIIRHWVRENNKVIESEVNSDIEIIRESLMESSSSHYLIAKDDSGNALGVMGFGTLNVKMALYQSNPATHSVGLLTAFLSPDARGRGLGKSLLLSIFDKARETGATEMIWSSNPRFRETAWKFYTTIAGSPIGTVNDLFYPGSVSPVWRKSFT